MRRRVQRRARLLLKQAIDHDDLTATVGMSADTWRAAPHRGSSCNGRTGQLPFVTLTGFFIMVALLEGEK
jgi:hypothetical protein